ncbi:DUF1801 domain-containing protein [Nocardioides bruguierae]|uniref:DUF1801 domain-containing protein n=1 Tax=Nocardioides bruguierae TaxID=2945102 RepID=UPI002021B336|nr:DUF1801 domain-containing protein [Nocardioides bruguierae]MCL8023974.1 DUF1801 domain-containing protein [Nocardioides bruguierae]
MSLTDPPARAADTDLHATVDDYVGSHPARLQIELQELRRAVHAAVPIAGERMRRGLPTFTMDGTDFLSVEVRTDHLRLAPLPRRATAELAEAMAPYVKDGGLEVPLVRTPYALVGRVAATLSSEAGATPLH